MTFPNHIVAYVSPFLQMASCRCKHLFHLFSKGCLQEFIFCGGKVLFERPLIYNSTPTSDFVIPALVVNPQILANYTDLWYSAQNSHLFLLRFCANCTCQSIFKLRKKQNNIKAHTSKWWFYNLMEMYEVTLIVLIDTSGYELFKPCIFIWWAVVSSGRTLCYKGREATHSVFQIRDRSQVNDLTKKASWPNKWHISIKLNIAKKN